MSQYVISAAIKNYVKLADDNIYRNLDELLFRRNGLAVAVHDLKGCYKGTFVTVLQIISSATLRWKKPFELLRVQDFIQGRPDSGCYSPGMSDRTVYRALKILCAEGLLARITANDGRDVHYALNYEVIMERVGNAVDSMHGQSLVWQETARLHAEIQGSNDFALLVRAIKHFAGRVIRDTKEFIQTLRNIGEKAVATLEGAVRTAKEASRKHSEHKASKKAERPLIRGSSVDPEAGLELWHKEVRDSDSHLGYVPARTGKLIGQMKNWLKEQVAQGKSEEEIRVYISQIVRKWEHVPDNERELQCVSATGKPYKTRMSYTPNFDVFYAHRTAICPLLEETCEPGKFADGTERERVRYL